MLHWQRITPAWWVCNNCAFLSGGMINFAASAIITPTLATMSALSVSMPLVCYESGDSILDIGDTFTYYTMLEAHADSRWLSVYNQYYSAIKSAGLTGVCLHFNDIGASIFGTWGYNPNMYGRSGLAAVLPKQQSLYNYISANPKMNLPFLLKRDLDPASNDNDPMWLEKAA